MAPLVGRRAELDAVREVLADLPGSPAHLVLEGPAGIGKSTVWSAALGMARTDGFTVLASRPSAGEAAVPWAGLSDLLGAVAEPALANLPEPQRRALEIALARRDPEQSPPDDLSIRLAASGVLAALAAEGPVVIAIDDLQWLDAATTGVLAFALPRSGGARVGLLATYRTSGGDPLAEAASADANVRPRGTGGAPRGAQATPDPALHPLLAALRADLRRVEVGPLDEDPLRAIVRDHIAGGVARATIDQVCRVSGGNPLYAIELARTATGTLDATSAEISAPAGLSAVVDARFGELPDGARELSTVIAVTDPLPWDDARALAEGDVTERELDAAIGAGFLVSSGGTISFAHPLLAAVVLGRVSEPHRRRIHRAFAERWPEHESAATHLAAAASGPDSDVARALDVAGDRARRRGAPSVAAGLYGQAAGLTPDDDRDERARREIESALAHFAAGDTDRARQLLEAVAARPGGVRRAEALSRLAGIVWAAEGDRAGMQAFERALPAAAGNPAVEGDIHDNLAWLTCWLGDMPRAYEHVQIARESAERVGDPALLARVLDKYGQIEFQTGRDLGLESSRKAIDYEVAAGGIGEATVNRSMILIWSDRLDEARADVRAILDRVLARGDERLRPEILSRLALVELRACNWPEARALLDEALELATTSGLGTGGMLRTLGYLNAAQGRSAEALALVDEHLPVAREQGAAWNIIRLLNIAGGTNLSLGNVEAAADQLDEAVAMCQRIGVGEPGIFRVEADAVEALVAAGRLDRAGEVLATFERQSTAVGRPWGIAGATRGRALLEAALGRLDVAREKAGEAIRLSQDLGQPIELARAQLVAGTIERRAGHRREARNHLAAALAGFERLDSRLWAARAAAELGRISGRAPSDDGLTATEERVAALVAEGLTNQEVAARLFVTVRTIEANLTRIYQKLGVRSRTELSRRLAAAAEAVVTGAP